MPRSAPSKAKAPPRAPPGTPPRRGASASPCTGSGKKRIGKAVRQVAAAAKRGGASRPLFAAAGQAPVPGTGEEWCERMTRAKEDIYARCSLKRQIQPGTREKCSKAMMESSLDQMVRVGRITASDRFLDLGSAVGNVVFSIASRTGCSATGVELIKHNHEVALEALPHMHKYWRDNGMGERKIEFVNSDLRLWLAGRERDYDVVWISNMLFPVEVDAYVINRLRHFKPGTRIFTMKDLLPHYRLERSSQAEDAKWFTFTDLTWPAGGVEWFPGTGEWYMYTRTEYMGEDGAQQ
eukprot:TRINITY_DN4854_c0_g1_i6.p1 TRINITY_DN4854_c0_g1~~TRINITY_DN4854_c0_g1_i6.p1  ORF type:complete len:322 (+),score=132.02 TRINITY_DN4854_c0_g1_i6:85-966(+)